MAAGCDPAKASESVQITTGSGVERVPKLRLLRFQALDRIRTNFPVLCHTLPATAGVDGVLGLDFLGAGRLAINFMQGTVVLE